jgi:carbonic anhydrase
VIRSLVLSAVKLGTTGCVLIHHTNCGLFEASNEELREAVREAAGAETGIDFLPFADLDESVREDVARLRAVPELPRGYEVVGFAYDVDSGRLRLVEA